MCQGSYEENKRELSLKTCHVLGIALVELQKSVNFIFSAVQNRYIGHYMN